MCSHVCVRYRTYITCINGKSWKEKANYLFLIKKKSGNTAVRVRFYFIYNIVFYFKRINLLSQFHRQAIAVDKTCELCEMPC